MSKLRPCPFCGADAEFRERENINPQGGKQYGVRCSNPKCIGKKLEVWRVHKNDVICLWNRRVGQTDCPWK